MNKAFYLLLILLAFSCSKENSGSETNPNLIVSTGTWILQELRITPAQDINEDGQTTTNVMDELDCISGTLQLNSDYTWTFSGTDVVVTTITGGLFKFFCAESPRTAQGVWDLNGNTIRLADQIGSLTIFTIDSQALTLTNTLGNILPGVQAEVYSKVLLD